MGVRNMQGTPAHLETLRRVDGDNTYYHTYGCDKVNLKNYKITSIDEAQKTRSVCNKCFR